MKNVIVMIVYFKIEYLVEVVKEVDILVVVIGCGYFVIKEFVKLGVVVIDVGMNCN